jgi:hypothetical protein
MLHLLFIAGLMGLVNNVRVTDYPIVSEEHVEQFIGGVEGQLFEVQFTEFIGIAVELEVGNVILNVGRQTRK